MFNRVLCSLIGSFLVSIGISIIVMLNYGMPSFDTFVLVISKLLSIEYTTSLRVTQFIIFIVLLWLKKYFNIKFNELLLSVISVIVVTLFIDFVSIYAKIIFEKNLMSFVIGFILYSYGITLLVQPNLFLAPNDKLLNEISFKTTHTYAFYKVAGDILLLIISLIVIWNMNYNISVSFVSIFLTFFTGIFVGIFSKMNRTLLKKFKLFLK
ncbi:MAG: hypothetical protein ACK5NF_05035 [Bacilli bacterium]